MKKLFIAWVCLVTFGALVSVVSLRSQPALALVAPQPMTVSLAWEPSYLTPLQTWSIHGFPTLTPPVTNWPIVLNVAGTKTNADVLVVAPNGAYFFALSVSNIHGRFFFTNLVEIPPFLDLDRPFYPTGVR